MAAKERVNYGLDTPGFLRAFATLAVVFGAGAVLLSVKGFGVLSFIAGVFCAWWIFCLAFFITGSKILKLRARDEILSRIAWRGDERVLDIGCGHGLMLVGAAKRLTTGRATGIDLWRQVDQLNNSPENTARNARIEGVADRVELRTGDARKLDFPDASFDLILSSSALHDITQNTAERDQVMRAIIRILKPGGRVAIYDFRHMKEYQQIFLESGMEQVKLSGWLHWYLPLAQLLTAIKPRRA
jgi:ubiquinone/menaquinone biosynthesis C-methylase UbiE